MDDSSNRLISGVQVLAVLILSVATALIYQVINHYQASGDELLVNNNFHNNFDGWMKSDSGITMLGDNPSVVQLSSEGGNKTIAIRQTLPNLKKGQRVRFAGAMKIQGVGRGNKAWEAARMIFVGMDDDGRSIYNAPHILVALNGTTDWERFSKVFVASSNAASYYVEIQLVNVKGAIWVKDLSLQPVKVTMAFSLYWMVCVLLWAMAVLWILAPHLRNMFASKWNIFIMVLVVGALLGALVSTDIKNSMIGLLQFFVPGFDGDTVLFRFAHFLVYGLLSIVVFWRAQSGRPEAVRFGLLILFAMSTEILQFLVDGRTPRVSDFLVDVSGIASAVFISQLFSPYKSCKQESGQYYL